MTAITIKKTSDEIIKGIEVSGHAGYADSGEDIVCAAISVLTINLVNSIEKLTPDTPEVFQDADKGIIKIDFTDIPSDETKLLLNSFELGVNGIFEQYGKKYLNIKIRR